MKTQNFDLINQNYLNSLKDCDSINDKEKIL